MFRLEDEYKKLALEYNLTEIQIKDIFESQFHFARKAMREGVHNEADTFKNINFIKLGKLYVKRGVIEKYAKNAIIKLERGLEHFTNKKGDE